jgi:thioesterase domain-containing protein
LRLLHIETEPYQLQITQTDVEALATLGARCSCIFAAVRDQNGRSSFLLQSWRPYIAGDTTVSSIDCTHNEMLTAESAATYGDPLKHLLG